MRSPRSLSFLFVWAILGALLSPRAVEAQTTCDLVASDYFRTLQSPSGEIVFVRRPVIRCRDGTRISADSAEIFSARNYSQFFENVEFQDSATVLTTDRAHFFSQEGRLQAWGSVALTDRAEGSRITGDTLVYLRPIEARPTERITVTGRRPHATLYPAPLSADSLEASGAPSRGSPDEPPGQVPDTGAGRIGPDSATTEVEDGRQRGGEVGGGGPEEVKGDPARRTADSVAGVRAGPRKLPEDSAVLSAAPVREEADSTRDTTAIQGTEEGSGTGPGPATRAAGDGPAASAPKDAARVPYEVDADRIFLEGSRYFRATGSVEITRDSLEAYADSVEYDQRAGRLFLTESARLLAADYVLLGRVITLVLPGDEISEIVSRPRAELTGRELRLTAPEIRLYLTDGQAERLVAVHRTSEADSATGPLETLGDSGTTIPRPRAVATDFLLVADSIEARTPGEVLQQVVATGRARGESLSRDSLNTPSTPEVARGDWIEGDTVVASFEPDTSALPSDTARARYRLDRVVATGAARSLYRMVASDTTGTEGRLALHYVQGRMISIQMEAGEVRDMEVQGQTRGVYLEPVRRAPADSTRAGARGPAAAAEARP